LYSKLAYKVACLCYSYCKILEKGQVGPCSTAVSPVVRPVVAGLDLGAPRPYSGGGSSPKAVSPACTSGRSAVVGRVLACCATLADVVGGETANDHV
jgi:hypothetical protein